MTPKIPPVDTDHMRFFSNMYTNGSETERFLWNGANEIDDLRAALAELDPEPVVCGCHEAGCPHTPIAKLPRQELVNHFRQRLATIENKTIERCVQLCLLERDKADKREPHDTPGSTMNLDHIMGQGWMANLLAKKLQALKKEG